MELVQPVERVGQEEVADFVPPVVEDERAPLPVLSLAGVRVLVEGRAVEAREPVRIFWKVPGHPVQDDGDACGMAGIDEGAEVVGRAEATRRREEPGDLVAPRSRERVLHHREQLDVREPHLLHVRNQPVGELPVREVAIPFLRNPGP